MMWRQGQIYGGLKGRFGAGTMDCEPDNPEYLQHHGQKVLKGNKRRTKVVSCSGNPYSENLTMQKIQHLGYDIKYLQIQVPFFDCLKKYIRISFQT